MRPLHRHRPLPTVTLAQRVVAGNWVAPESRDPDDETELAFHLVWLARQLQQLPAPDDRRCRLPRQTPRQRAEIRQAVEDLQTAAAAAP